MNYTDLFSATILLVLVLDPFGNLPLVVAALDKVAPARHLKILLRESFIAYLLLLLFMIGGRTFMTWLGLSDVSLSITGGIILFLISLRMVFSHKEGIFGEIQGGEPFIVPLAVPMIAGPSALATVMLMASRDPDKLYTWAVALTLAMVVSTAVLLMAGKLKAVLGERVVNAFERLMGLLLTALAVEMLLGGIRTFVASLSS